MRRTFIAFFVILIAVPRLISQQPATVDGQSRFVSIF